MDDLDRFYSLSGRLEKERRTLFNNLWNRRPIIEPEQGPRTRVIQGEQPRSMGRELRSPGFADVSGRRPARPPTASKPKVTDERGSYTEEQLRSQLAQEREAKLSLMAFSLGRGLAETKRLAADLGIPFPQVLENATGTDLTEDKGLFDTFRRFMRGLGSEMERRGYDVKSAKQFSREMSGLPPEAFGQGETEETDR